jgi:hypothetical protein
MAEKWKAIAGVLVLAAFTGLAREALAAEKDRPVPGQGRVIIDGEAIPFRSWEGGEARSEPVSEKATTSGWVKKHGGGLIYRDLALELPLVPSPIIEAWIQSFLAANPARKNIVVERLRPNGTFASGRSFLNGLLTEVTFPALDAAASKESGELTLRITPESSQSVTSASTAKGLAPQSARARGVAGFRLAIDGLDCDRVTHVEPIAIRLQVVDQPGGELRDYEKQPGRLEIPNLTFMLHESEAATWDSWLQDFVVRGNNGDGQEKQGTLEFLDREAKAIFTLRLKHLGIIGLRREKFEPDGATSGRVRAELYCEEMELNPAAPATVASSPAPDKKAPQEEPPPSPQEKPPEPAKREAAGHPEDQGARDPAGIPRFPESIRRSFASNKNRAFVEERAEYTAKVEMEKAEKFFADRMKELGWKEFQRTEAGEPTKGTHVIESRYELEKRRAILRLAQTKEGLTSILWTVQSPPER